MSREPEQSASALVTTATARLGLAADGHDIHANVDGALRAILTATFERDGSDVTGEALLLCVAALAGALEATTKHFGEYPLATTVNLGLRSAGGIVRTIGVPPDEWSDQARTMLPAWRDWTAVLIAEMEAATLWRRLAARVGQDWNTLSTADERPRLH